MGENRPMFHPDPLTFSWPYAHNTTMTERELIKKLEDIRTEREWSERQMAQALGCARTTYSATKLGVLPVGKTLARGIGRAFPELRDAAVSLLLGDRHISCAEDESRVDDAS